MFELCRRLADRFEILVLAPHTKGAQLHEFMDGIEIRRFRYSFTKWEQLAYAGGILSNLKLNRLRYFLLPSFIVSQLVFLYEILRRERIDVIHAHWLIPQGLTAAVLSVLVKRMPPILCTSHGGDILGLNGWLVFRIKRWTLSQIQFLTVVSQVILEQVRTLGSRSPKAAVIPMGVDTKTFTPSSTRRDSYRLLFVGRLVEKKGLSYLIAALPIILKQYPLVRLDIVGSGPEEFRLREQVAQLNIAQAVHFHGAIHNSSIPEFYRRSTLLMMPSIITSKGDQEGLGLVLAEALACECPVVASDLPGVRDVIMHRHTGLLVTERDSTAIARAVIELISKPELRMNLARKGRMHVIEKFDWDEVALKYGDLLEDLSLSAPQ